MTYILRALAVHKNKASTNSSILHHRAESFTMSSQPLYPAYLPTRPDGFQPTVNLPYFEAEEPGSRADATKPSLFRAGAVVENITPRVGSEVRGVQLTQLSKAGLDEVALLAAERGVLVFVSRCPVQFSLLVGC